MDLFSINQRWGKKLWRTMNYKGDWCPSNSNDCTWVRLAWGFSWVLQVQLNGQAISYPCIFNCGYLFIFNHESNGEMIYLNPTTGSFATFASDYTSCSRLYDSME